MYSSLLRNLMLAGVMLGLMAAPAVSAPKGVRTFDKTTWAQLKRELPRPSVVVFTTTDCAYCPDVIEALAVDVKKGQTKAKLVIVVMDGTEQPEAMAADKHYRKGDAMYVFEGQAMALRYSVDPDWRGMTPYVAMLGRSGEPKFVVGRPSKADVAALLGKP